MLNRINKFLIAQTEIAFCKKRLFALRNPKGHSSEALFGLVAAIALQCGGWFWHLTAQIKYTSPGLVFQTVDDDKFMAIQTLSFLFALIYLWGISKSGSLQWAVFNTLSETPIIPGARERVNEIREFIWQQKSAEGAIRGRPFEGETQRAQAYRENLRINQPMQYGYQHAQVLLNDDNEQWEDTLDFRAVSGSDRVLIEFKKDPKAFVEKYFPQSQSLTRHYLERATINGQTNMKFILNSLLIPRRKTLSVEVLKNILYTLVHAQGFPAVSGAQGIYNETISKQFENYSDAEIGKVFTRPYLFSDYASLICSPPIPFPVFTSMEQIYANVLVVKNTINPEVLDLDQKVFKGLTVKHLKSKRDYEQCGEKFGNCVRGKFKEQNSTDFITFYNDEDPVACIELGSGMRILEAKGIRNEYLRPGLIDVINDIISQGKVS